MFIEFLEKEDSFDDRGWISVRSSETRNDLLNIEYKLDNPEYSRTLYRFLFFAWMEYEHRPTGPVPVPTYLTAFKQKDLPELKELLMNARISIPSNGLDWQRLAKRCTLVPELAILMVGVMNAVHAWHAAAQQYDDNLSMSLTTEFICRVVALPCQT